MSRVKMFNQYLQPYKAAIDAGVGSVMSSFNDVDGVPASGNKWLLTDLLRDRWGFTGFVVSDYTSVNEMTAHGLGDLQAVSALALNAGLDMDMVGEGFLTTLKKIAGRGKSFRRLPLPRPQNGCWKPNINWASLMIPINILTKTVQKPTF